jgi:hypothetical protein
MSDGSDVFLQLITSHVSLITSPWKLLGKGQIVADYSGPNARKFTHKKLR